MDDGNLIVESVSFSVGQTFLSGTNGIQESQTRMSVPHSSDPKKNEIVGLSDQCLFYILPFAFFVALREIKLLGFT
jgi:hypothetical protein